MIVEFVRATSENVSPGSIVRGSEIWGVGPHVYHDQEYIVKKVSGMTDCAFLTLEKCSFNSDVLEDCDQCTVSGWSIDGFEVKIFLTKDEIERAVSLPSADEAMAFFMRSV